MTRILLGIAFALIAVVSASAQNYPNRPITMVVPYPAGGPSDAVIRNMGERMRVSLGQPLIVEYVSGAGGTVGTGRVARAAPDGYTLILGHFGTHVTNGAVYKMSFDLVKDFTPISLLPDNPYLIVAQKNLLPNTLKEFLAYLKANPGKVSMGHPGIGTGPHLLALQLASLAGSTMNYVPYRGSGPAMIDLVAGQIDLMVDQVQTSSAQVHGGKIRLLPLRRRRVSLRSRKSRRSRRPARPACTCRCGTGCGARRACRRTSSPSSTPPRPTRSSIRR